MFADNACLFAEEERRARNAKRRKLENEARNNRPLQGHDFGAMTAVPVQSYNNQGMSNSAVVENRAALRTENQNAAASLKAELMGSSDAQVPSMNDDAPHGVKRKAEEELAPETGEEEEEEEEDEGPATAEDIDLEAAGRAILEKAKADKKAAEDAARQREPDDAVR